VVIEPPRHARRAGVFEVDNGIFIAVKERLGKGISRPVGHSRELELGARVNALAEKAVENSRRGCAVKASVMEAQTNFYRVRHSPPSLSFKA
jgi:hypothetical protein